MMRSRGEDNKININIYNILSDNPDYSKFIEDAEKIGKGLSNSQLRKLYSQVKELEYDSDDFERQKYLIMIRINYQIKRNKNLHKLRKLNEILKECKNKRQVENFKDFMEAVIAYSEN